MRSFHPWPIFPHDLAPPAAKSLSLLFILQGLLSALELLAKAEANIPKNPSDIHTQLEQFLLFSLDHPFANKGGVLDQLCFYSENLLKASKINSNQLLNILEEMQNALLDLKSDLRIWKKKPPYPEEMVGKVQTLYGSLWKKFRAFFAALFIFLNESRTNENILLFILEHRYRFNQYLGPRTVEHLLCRLFPSGPCELRAAICEGYTRRGFTDFYAKQESLLDAIEWEVSSCPPYLH